VGCVCAHLRKPLVLGANLNKWSQWKSSVGLVVFHALIGQHGMHVECRVVGAGDTVLGWMVRRAFLMITGLCGMDVEGRVVGAGGIVGD